VAAYAPGALPFAVGQAAFTVVVVVLFNLLQLVGWVLVGGPAPHQVALPVSVPALADLDENSGTVRLVRLVTSIKLMGLTAQPPLTVAVRLRRS
jgi:hypothetical protein